MDRTRTTEPTVVSARYCLLEEIGQGPMATVFRALDTEMKGDVALKLFLPQYSSNARFALRFRQQLKTIAALSHPNLVSVLDYGLAGGDYFIAMEWLEGVSLSTYLAERGALSPASAVYVARQICAAVSAVHREGLIHRSLKPENVILASDGQVKVADAGHSELSSESGLSKTNVMLGNVGYLSPEQARGAPAGPESDVYSLGVILFEMLTDRLPFESNDSWSVVNMHAQVRPPSPRKLNPQVAPELAAAVERALHKTREGRFASVDELDAALSTFPHSGDLLWPIAPGHREKGQQNGTRQRSLPIDATRFQALAGAIQRRLASLLEDRRRPPFGAVLLLHFAVSFIVAFLLFNVLAGAVIGRRSDASAAVEDQSVALGREIHKPLPSPTLFEIELPAPRATPTPQEPAEDVGDSNNPPGGEGPPPDRGPPDHAGPPDDAGPPPGKGPPNGVGPPDHAGPP